ncbi:aldose epimerase family protein [Pacificoceanicola onchidii]|uniref:aldose epimerase family protein n=1 Tax=Pacificoceanicola onchidii TaxID=2562685 RepID=UPI0010A5E5E3|nr:aldose epimerase family protein [Pacificoceanicola onchidii]
MDKPIEHHVLSDGDTEVTVLSIGCAIQDWIVGGRRVVLGYENFEDYRENPMSMGITIGRVANRTADCSFELDGATYHLTSRGGQHHLHGGPGGLGWRSWSMTDQTDTAVKLKLHSPDGDQGYPGAVDFEVQLSLNNGALTWDMTAIPDRKTPINMAQHVYFNLAGQGDILDHWFRLKASHYTPTGPDLIPTGDIAPVDRTRFDFREGCVLREKGDFGEGYDLNYALDLGGGPAAEVQSQDGMTLQMWTNRKGLQFYTCGHLGPFGSPHPGVTHKPFAGFCIEAQDFPNTVNTPAFGSVYCTPDSPYRQRTTIRISLD